MKKCKDGEKMELLSVRIPSWQSKYLKVHCEETGNKLPEIIRLLISYYIDLK